MFLTPRAISSANVSAPFLERGIKDYTTGRPSAVTLQGLISEREVAFVGYRENIAAFVHATAANKKVVVSLPNLWTEEFANTTPLPFSPPTVAFGLTFENPPASILEKVAARFDSRGRHMKRGKFPIILVDAPTSADVPAISKLASATMIGDGNLSEQGLDAYLLLNGIIASFLSTNSYSAFSTKRGRKAPEIVIAASWSTVDLYGDDDKELGDKWNLVNQTARRGEVPASWVEANPGKEWVKVAEDTTFVEFGRFADELVYTAKPSTIPHTNNIFTVSSVPDESGLFSPYFRGMHLPDGDLMINAFYRHFFRNVVDSMEDIQYDSNEMRRGLRSLAQTPTGQEMLHALLGINLALDTQARLGLIFDGGYKGFVLLGDKFGVVVDNQWHLPKEPKELIKDLRMFAPSHLSLRMDLAAALNEMMPLEGAMEVECDVEKLSTPMGFILELHKRAYEGAPESVRNRVNGALSKSPWSGTYTPVNPTTLGDLLVKRYSPDAWPKPENYLYVPDISGDLRDRQLLWLLTFGPTVPSFRNGSGVEYDVPATAAPDPLSGINSTTHQPELGVICVGMKPWSVGRKEWIELETSHRIKQNMKERAGRYRVHQFVGKERDLIWGSLKKSIGDTAKRTTAPSAGKKRVAEGDVVEGPSKRLRTEADMAAFLENL
jgi:hypothetical protein